MKIFVLYSILLVSQMIFTINGCAKSDKDEVVKVHIHTLNIIAHTEYDIGCSQFFDTFDGKILSYKIDNKDEISRILPSIQSSKEVLNAHVDTRSVICLVHQSSKVDTLCFGGPGLMQYYLYNNTPMKLTDDFIIDYIDSLQRVKQ